MFLTLRERKQLRALEEPLLRQPEVRQMEQFTQHGRVSTLEHCRRVAERSFWLSLRLGWQVDRKALVTGALLHDFYGYDWHEKRPGQKLHGFTHPAAACENASRVFQLSRKERGIIRSHMWPLTLFHAPASREAWLVSAADKWCSLEETLNKRK